MSVKCYRQHDIIAVKFGAFPNSGTRCNCTANNDQTVVSRLPSDENVTDSTIQSAVVFCKRVPNSQRYLVYCGKWANNPRFVVANDSKYRQLWVERNLAVADDSGSSLCCG